MHLVAVAYTPAHENHANRVEPRQVGSPLQSPRGVDRLTGPGDPVIERRILVECPGALGPDPEDALVLPNPTDEGVCVCADDAFGNLAADLESLIDERSVIGDVLCFADARVAPCGLGKGDVDSAEVICPESLLSERLAGLRPSDRA